MKTSVLLIILLSVLSCAAQENPNENRNDGNSLLRDCSELVRSIDNNFSHSTFGSDWCLGYIQGFVAALDAVEIHESKDVNEYASHQHALVCFPERSTYGQNVRVVVKFLQDHPDKLHLGEGTLTLAAMREAFPCSPPKDTSKGASQKK